MDHNDNSSDKTKARPLEFAALVQTLRASVLDSLPDPAWIKDAEHRYVAVNDAFRRLCEFQTG